MTTPDAFEALILQPRKQNSGTRRKISEKIQIFRVKFIFYNEETIFGKSKFIGRCKFMLQYAKQICNTKSARHSQIL